MTLNTAQRRQALLDVFDAHEEMAMLLACLPRSPALWVDDSDSEEVTIKEGLIEKGLLTHGDGFCTTTPEGCEALIAYVRGEDVDDCDDVWPDDCKYDLTFDDEQGEE